MGFRIEERFVVRAPADAIFAFLVDARRVVTCLPGAELAEAIDARTFRGSMKVKVGPVKVAYQGRVLLTEVDPAGRRVRLAGEGREGTGAGSARMSLESVSTPLPGGETEVSVRADVEVAGRIVQLGRGMMEQVSAQLLRQFAVSLRRELERAPAAGEPAPAAPSRPAAEPVRVLPLVLGAAWRAVVDLVRRLRAKW